MAKKLDLNQQYYQRYFRFAGRSKWMEKIWSEAFGAIYPAGLHHFGYVTQNDLEEIARRLQVAEGATLLDIGCGKGGPGLWMAQKLGLRLIGIDVIPEAIEAARTFQQDFEIQYPADFQIGEFLEIPLEDASVDAVMSIDSLWTVTDKIQALREVKRVMKPGARFLFTHWDLLTVEAVPLLEQSGLRFVRRDETPNWKAFQQKVYEGIHLHQKELVAEMGEAATMLLYEAKASPPYLDHSIRRIYEFMRPAD